jgi:hypothetical protein
MSKFVFVAVIAFVVGAFMLSNNFDSLEHGEAKFVFDTSTVDTAVANQLHQFLIEEAIYDDKTGDVLLLKKSKAGVWVAKFPVYQGGEISPLVLKNIEKLSIDIKQNVLNNEPLEVHITNAGYQSVQFFRV